MILSPFPPHVSFSIGVSADFRGKALPYTTLVLFISLSCSEITPRLCGHRFRRVWNAPPPFAECFALIRLTQRRCLMCAKSSPSSLNSYLQTQVRTLCRLHLSLSFYCSCNQFAWCGCQLAGSWRKGERLSVAFLFVAPMES